MKDLMNQIPLMRKARNEMMALRNTEHSPPSSGPSFKREKLLSLIPSRDEADALLQIYLDTFETTFRILHVPTFQKQYDQFWASPGNAPDSFLVILLLVITVVYCIPPLDQASFVGFSSSRRNRAIEYIDICTLWISQHSQKHMTMAYFQVHCLLHLAKRMNIVKVKRMWTSAGNVLRIAISAGLHREPSMLGHKISVFDQEMRRRLWVTIAEFELHDSLDRGMAPAIRDGSWDSRPPSNINDEDFDLDSQTLPPSRPITEFTVTAFLHQSSQNLSSRIELVALINNIGSSMNYEQVLAQDEKLMQCLAEIPNWDTMHTTPRDQQTLGHARLARSLLWLQIQQLVILLHRPFAQDGQHVFRYRYSRSSCVTSAISVLNRYNKPDIATDFSLVVMRTDLFRAAFSLCYDLVTMNSGSSGKCSHTRPITEFVAQITIYLSRLRPRAPAHRQRRIRRPPDRDGDEIPRGQGPAARPGDASISLPHLGLLSGADATAARGDGAVAEGDGGSHDGSVLSDFVEPGRGGVCAAE